MSCRTWDQQPSSSQLWSRPQWPDRGKDTIMGCWLCSNTAGPYCYLLVTHPSARSCRNLTANVYSQQVHGPANTLGVKEAPGVSLSSGLKMLGVVTIFFFLIFWDHWEFSLTIFVLKKKERKKKSLVGDAFSLLKFFRYFWLFTPLTLGLITWKWWIFFK